MKNTEGHNEDEDSHAEFYGDSGVASKNEKMPRWLKYSNWFFVFFGIVWLFFFWNGSYGWLDRGYWSELQRAANTTYPFTTTEILESEQKNKD